MLEAPGKSSSETARNARLQALPLQETALKHFLADFTREKTFDNLSAGLGEDKAKAVVSGIGQAALEAAPELHGAGLGSIVTQTIARLTQQDLAGIARNESSAIGRAQSIIHEEIKSQKSQTVAANIHGAGALDARAGADTKPLGSVVGATTSGRDGGRRYGEMKDTSPSEAASLAREIGAKPGDASLFVGSSSTMRDAIRGFLKDGKAITDDDVRNLGDVKAVMGLVRAGKLKADDPRIPPSVQRIINDMKDQGIDPATADPKVIDKYFKEHPSALEAAKREAKNDIAAKAKATDAQIDKEATQLKEAAIKRAAATQTAPGKEAEKAPLPKGRDVKLTF